jgi:hypothetical protein
MVNHLDSHLALLCGTALLLLLLLPAVSLPDDATAVQKCDMHGINWQE